jgi:hypothetical protein
VYCAHGRGLQHHPGLAHLHRARPAKRVGSRVSARDSIHGGWTLRNARRTSFATAAFLNIGAFFSMSGSKM